MTYRDDAGTKCAACGHGFPAEDLVLDAGGAWVCDACARRRSEELEARLTARETRTKRLVQAVSVTAILLVLGYLGWRVIAYRDEQHAQLVRRNELAAAIFERFRAFREAHDAWLRLRDERACDLADLRLRTPAQRLRYFDYEYLASGGRDGWHIASRGIQSLVFFLESPRTDAIRLVGQDLDALEKEHLVVVLLPESREADVGAGLAAWSGKMLLVDIDRPAEPLCWRPLSVRLPRDRIDDGVGDAAGAALAESAHVGLWP